MGRKALGHKLISVRLSDDTLERIDSLCRELNWTYAGKVARFQLFSRLGKARRVEVEGVQYLLVPLGDE